MASEIKVSFVIPVYNVAPFLKQCLDSVVNQTLKEIEVICVDDGSQDESLHILEEYAQRDSRIHIFMNKTEGPGAAHARNLGLSKVRGDYVLILDSDDYFDLELAEKTYQKAKETDAEIVLFDNFAFDSHSGNLIPRQSIVDFALLPEKDCFSSSEVAKNLFQISDGSAWNNLYKVAFIRENQLQFQAIHVIDDSFFTCSSYIPAERIAYTREKLLFYRVNNVQSQVSNTDRDPLSPVKMLEELHSFLKKRGDLNTFEESFSKKIFRVCNWYLKSLSNYQGIKLLRDTLNKDFLEKYLFSIPKEKIPTDIFLWGTEIKNKDFDHYVFDHCAQYGFFKSGFFAYHFPTNQVKHNDKVVLYAAGAVGNAFFTQNLSGKFCNIVAWVDKNSQNLAFPVTGPETLKNTEFDKIMVAVESENFFESIRTELINLGIPENKIIWGDPFLKSTFKGAIS